MKRLIPLVLLLCLASILLTGCGGSEETKAEPQYANVNEMRAELQQAGITGVDWWEGYILYAKTAGRLQLDSERRLELTTFANQQAKSDYIKVVEGFGGVIVDHSLWVVAADTMADAQAVQAALGGEIR